MPGLTIQERNALTRFTQQVRRLFPDAVERVTLFGSKARGDAAKHSDVDVLVILTRPTVDLALRQEVYHLTHDILLDTGVVISAKVLGREQYTQLRAWGEPLLLNIERDGVRL